MEETLCYNKQIIQQKLNGYSLFFGFNILSIVVGYLCYMFNIPILNNEFIYTAVNCIYKFFNVIVFPFIIISIIDTIVKGRVYQNGPLFTYSIVTIFFYIFITIGLVILCDSVFNIRVPIDSISHISCPDFFTIEFDDWYIVGEISAIIGAIVVGNIIKKWSYLNTNHPQYINYISSSMKFMYGVYQKLANILCVFVCLVFAFNIPTFLGILNIPDLITEYFKYFLYVGLVVFVTISLPILFLAPKKNITALGDYLVIVFTSIFTCSSNMVLPLNLKFCKDSGVSYKVGKFFVIISHIFNRCGVLTYLLCVSFSSSYGIELTVLHTCAIILLCVGVSILCSGTPSSGTLFLIPLFSMCGIPCTFIPFLFIGDKFFDMIRTPLNNIAVISSAIVLDRILKFKIFYDTMMVEQKIED